MQSDREASQHTNQPCFTLISLAGLAFDGASSKGARRCSQRSILWHSIVWTALPVERDPHEQVLQRSPKELKTPQA